MLATKHERKQNGIKIWYAFQNFGLKGLDEYDAINVSRN